MNRSTAQPIRANAFADLVHRFRVHRAAVLRMRMGEHDRRARPVGGRHGAARPGRPPAIRRLVEQHFETSGRAGDLTKRHQAAPGRVRRRLLLRRRDMSRTKSRDQRGERVRPRHRTKMAGPIEHRGVCAGN